MKLQRIIPLGLCLAALLAAAPAFAQTTSAVVVATCGTPPTTYAAGANRQVTQDTAGNLCINDAGGGGGAVTANQGTPNAGGATNSWPVQGAGVAGTPAGGVVSVQGVASGTTLPVTATQSPSSASTAGVAPVQSSAVETGHVIKAGAGNLYSISASADATLSAAAWALMVFNATTVPAAGAVTPAWCVLLPAGATAYTGGFSTPMYLGTGISVAVSVGQTCFTKVDSAHGFISANAQ